MTPSWMTLEQCARYLSKALDDAITESDVMALIADARLTPSWYVRRVLAQQVFPVTRLVGGYLHDNLMPLQAGAEGYERGERRVLYGVVRVPLDENPVVRDWIRAAMLDDEPVLFSGDGIIAQEPDGSRWQMLTELGEGYEPHPLVDTIPVKEMVIQRADADAFICGERPAEGQAPAEPTQQRFDDLRAELESILRKMAASDERITAGTVMPKLRARIGIPGTCIIDQFPDGVLWSRGTGTPEKLTTDMLAKRIDRWKDRNTPKTPR